MHYYDYQLTRNHGIMATPSFGAAFAFCEAECVLKISVPKTTHSAIQFLLSTQPVYFHFFALLLFRELNNYYHWLHYAAIISPLL